MTKCLLCDPYSIIVIILRNPIAGTATATAAGLVDAASRGAQVSVSRVVFAEGNTMILQMMMMKLTELELQLRILQLIFQELEIKYQVVSIW